ncbi:MAG: hypothetical protein U0Q16_17545 [Bryobacteraceae bacterium]
MKRICDLPPDERQQALAQVGLLVGLRSFGVQFKMELKRMGVTEFAKNEFLLYFEEARKQGLAEGRADLLRMQLDSSFGPLPKWAESRLRRANRTKSRSGRRKFHELAISKA